MSRGLWFVGRGRRGGLRMVRARRAAEAFTLDGLEDRLGARSSWAPGCSARRSRRGRPRRKPSCASGSASCLMDAELARHPSRSGPAAEQPGTTTDTTRKAAT